MKLTLVSTVVGLTALLLLLALVLLQGGCAVSTRFRGPGFDPRRGVAVDTVPETVVVALTWGRLDRATRGPFDAHIDRVRAAIDEQPGLVGASFRIRLLGDEVWTMTAWSDEAALGRFVESSLHRAAMDAGGPATRDFRYRQLRLPRGELPLAWSRALEILAAPAADPTYPPPDEAR